MNNDTNLVFIDGACNLCNGWVKFIHKRDKKKIFRYASLQSNIAKEILKKNNYNYSEISTIILIKNNKDYTKSTAIIEILRSLKSPYKLLLITYIIPRIFRDSLYNFIAKRRYNWFGKKDNCLLPSEIDEYIFLD